MDLYFLCYSIQTPWNGTSSSFIDEYFRILEGNNKYM